MKIHGSSLMTSVLFAATLLSTCLPGRAQVPGAMVQGKAERSLMLTVTVGGVTRQLLPEDLAKMPQTTLTAHNAHSNRDENYSGVAVADLLGGLGLPLSKGTQPALLRSYVRAQGTDNYFVIYSATEMEPDLNTAKIIVATRMDGRELAEDGRFKLVSSSDKKPARWVHNLISLTLVTLN